MLLSNTLVYDNNVQCGSPMAAVAKLFTSYIKTCDNEIEL